MALTAEYQPASLATATRPGVPAVLGGGLSNHRRGRLPSPVVPVFLSVTLCLASIAALVLPAAATLDRQAALGPRSTVETSLQLEADRSFRMVVFLTRRFFSVELTQRRRDETELHLLTLVDA